MSTLVPVSYRLDAELVEQVRAECERRGLSQSAAVREALALWLEGADLTRSQRRRIATELGRFVRDGLEL